MKLCCSECLSLVGAQSRGSMNNIRLMKHDISTGSKNYFRSYTLGSNIAMEISSMIQSHNCFRYFICDENLVIRIQILITNWDTFILTNRLLNFQNNGKPILKVLYRECIGDTSLIEEWKSNFRVEYLQLLSKIVWKLFLN